MTQSDVLKSKFFRVSFPLLMAVVGSSMFGIAPLFVRLTDIGPTATGAWRILLAMPMLFAWKLMEEKKHPKSKRAIAKSDIWLVILAGLFFAGDLGLWNISIRMTTIINATLFNNFVPLFVPLLMWLLYKEAPSWHYLVVAVVALTGSVILSGQDIKLDPSKLGGDILAIISAFSYTCYVMVLKRMRKHYNTPTILLGCGAISCIALFIMSYNLGENMKLSTANDWTGVICLAFLSHILGQGLMSYAMGHLSAKFIGLSLLVAPLVSVVVGWLAFGEVLSAWQMFGGLMVISSLLVARYEEKQAK